MSCITHGSKSTVQHPQLLAVSCTPSSRRTRRPHPKKMRPAKQALHILLPTLEGILYRDKLWYLFEACNFPHCLSSRPIWTIFSTLLSSIPCYFCHSLLFFFCYVYLVESVLGLNSTMCVKIVPWHKLWMWLSVPLPLIYVYIHFVFISCPFSHNALS